MGDEQKLELLHGFLRFYGEQGITEGGGLWAFQDSRFIIPNETVFVCSKCYRYWDKEKNPDGPPDIGSAPLIVTQVIPTDKLEEILQGKFKEMCPPNEHEFKLMFPTIESFKGHHVLKDGDWLTIYSKDEPRTMIWSGIVQLKKYPPFTESVSDIWIRSDQEEIDRGTWAKWFLDEHPATLVPYKKINASS
ncbi:MAG: hypothetical protein Q8R55_04830 [Candidatus Taylorbacteria bacterium]|nr:hypothetical protein [Candidatus Taylorbacteria bacterium]